MDIGKMSLGEFVEYLRKEKGLSMRQVAELAKISHTEVKRIEDGVRKQPSPQVLRFHPKALDNPYEELMEHAGYIDEFPEKEENSTAAAGIIGAEDFSKEELAQVNQYIAFIKRQRK